METSNVLTDKWEFKGISIIKTPYQEFRIKPFAKDGKDMGKLIVTAVNACKQINAENPTKVAEVLPDMFNLIKEIGAFHNLGYGPDLLQFSKDIHPLIERCYNINWEATE